MLDFIDRLIAFLFARDREQHRVSLEQQKEIHTLCENEEEKNNG